MSEMDPCSQSVASDASSQQDQEDSHILPGIINTYNLFNLTTADLPMSACI